MKWLTYKVGKRLLILSSIGIFALCLWVFKGFQHKSKSYYETWPVAEFSSGKIPRLKVILDGRELLLSFDLGFTGHVSLLDEQLKTFSTKTLLGKKNIQGVQGNQYQRNFYIIPKIKIGNIVLSNLNVEEESKESLEESLVVGGFPAKSLGKLGWKLFKTSVLYLDLTNSSITLCDSTETLKKQGVSLEAFARTPLFLDHDLIEFIAATPQGPLRCVLDTGSTFNFINRDNLDKNSLEQMVFDEKQMVVFPKFEIGTKDFGQNLFHALPLKLPFRVEAIMGMDFFLKHRVVIDFKNRELFICKQMDERPA